MKYLTYNQKIASLFAIVISILILINGFLLVQFVSNSRGGASQTPDQALSSVAKKELKSNTNTAAIKKIPDISISSTKPTPVESTTKKSPIVSVDISNGISELENSIQSIDYNLGFKDIDIDLTNLTK
jgi:hypothetical protein